MITYVEMQTEVRSKLVWLISAPELKEINQRIGYKKEKKTSQD